MFGLTQVSINSSLFSRWQAESSIPIYFLRRKSRRRASAKSRLFSLSARFAGFADGFVERCVGCAFVGGHRLIPGQQQLREAGRNFWVVLYEVRLFGRVGGEIVELWA